MSPGPLMGRAVGAMGWRRCKGSLALLLETRPDQTRPDQTRPDQTRQDKTRQDRSHTMALRLACLMSKPGPVTPRRA